MPNECYNYVRLTGPAAVIDELRSRRFCPYKYFPPPADLSGDAYFEWIQENYSTKWMVDDNSEPVQLEEREDGSLEAFFDSAWAPPYQFYRKLVATRPGLVVEYEYNEWGVGFFGFGVLRDGMLSAEPVHFSYRSEEEFKTCLAGAAAMEHAWNLRPFCPHFEEGCFVAAGAEQEQN